MSGERFVVITSVNPPGEAVRAYAVWDGWKVVVIGDRKTPEPWQADGVIYLGIDQQREMFGEFAAALPENAYARKMLGYAYAIKSGAEAIYDTDDDNFPYRTAAEDIDRIIRGRLAQRHDRCRGKNGWINVYSLFGADGCWPRGYPLEYVKATFQDADAGKSAKSWAVMQFLVDDDPDVDAIFRTLDGRRIFFALERVRLFDEGTFSPINSQSTLWLPPAYPAMFLPVGVADRVTDILRGYIATASLWEGGHVAGAASPIGHQRRNVHDLREDFRDETPLYLNARTWTAALLDVRGKGVAGAFYLGLLEIADLGGIDQTNIKLYSKFLEAAGLEL